MVVGALRVVTSQQLDGGILADNDEQTALHHHVECGIKDIDQLDGTLGNDTVGHIDEQAILHQQGVERHRRVGHTGQLTIIGIHQFGIIHCRHAERLHHHLADVTFGRGTAVESVIAAVVKAGAHVGHIAMESLGGVGIKGQTVHVHAIVVGKDRFEVGRLIVLTALARQASRFQVLPSNAAQVIQ